MILFPNAKINIGLNIVNKREDGYHNLETLFFPINWKDVLEIIPAKQFTFSSSGITINPERNSCKKAFDLLKNNYDIPNVHVHLHKNIPIGAGLGGGSSDASFTLMALDKLFDLRLPKKKLMEYALQCGADCPFFIENRPSLAQGVGEQLTSVSFDLSGYHLVVVYPSIFVSTKEAFSKIVPKQPNYPILEEIKKPISEWRLSNDFEDGVFEKHPNIANIKQQLDGAGAIYSSLSGSGSSVYAFFTNKPSFKFNDYLIFHQLL